MPTCPNGHQSGAEDWCEVCGHRMSGDPLPSGSVPPPLPPPPLPVGAPGGPPGGYGYPAADPDATAQADLCPQCRMPREAQAVFCEECRYNFLTHSPTSYIPPPPQPPSGMPLPPGFQLQGQQSQHAQQTPAPYDYQSSRPSQVNRPAEPLATDIPAQQQQQQAHQQSAQQQPPYQQPMQQQQQPLQQPHMQPPGPPQAPQSFPDPFAPREPSSADYSPDYSGAQQQPAPGPPPAPPYGGGGEDDWMLPPPTSPPSAPGSVPQQGQPGQPGQHSRQGQQQAQQEPYPAQQAQQAQQPYQQQQQEPPQPQQGPANWVAMIAPDREYFMAMMNRSGPEAAGLNLPAYSPAQQLALVGQQITIGRRRHSTGESPDIDLSRQPEDPGVSHQHAVLVQQPDGGWAVVDQNSTNGTTVNGGEDPLQPYVPIPLQDGDRVHVGAWTTITVHRA
ncbi:FHA domain-containing protein [Streptomyces sp. H27-D2]|uniref:FHA domain-containing protein n=1 Tax=Streptomyces sp. H27-D2 TaxID=3046304 RepID=UPI002DB81388|nr:FHA domain-containing protein [Streptomyces sp. H27-D2]MEC4020750.1 FHA domain-containing protein [Streptomyces sp. H27-D2]